MTLNVFKCVDLGQMNKEKSGNPVAVPVGNHWYRGQYNFVNP